MKFRFLKSLLLAAVIVGGIWVLFNKDSLQNPSDVVEMIKQKWNAIPTAYSNANSNPASPSNARMVQRPQFVTNVIRVASFRLSENVTADRTGYSIGMVANICRQYDAVALQQVVGTDNAFLARLTDEMNRLGAVGRENLGTDSQPKDNYYFFSDRTYSSGYDSQSAIVYNRRTLQLDNFKNGQAQHYVINDPDRILTREPLVGLFRTRGPQPNQAFTFTLVNVQFDPIKSGKEVTYLGELFRAIRSDGRGEDDVLIAGDFGAGDREFRRMGKVGLTWVVSNQATDTRNKIQSDNVVFNPTATVEYTGRGGVFDFLRAYNLRLENALQVSDHMPVWAEFSIFEGVNNVPVIPGRVAKDIESTQQH
ncbi:MAG: endonuclease/exonuclease/phosphatase [Mariniblastus sp.]